MRTQVTKTVRSGIGAPKASRRSTLKAAQRSCWSRFCFAAIHGCDCCARGGPLSQVSFSSEQSRGPHTDFVAKLIDAAQRGADEKLSLDTAALDLRELVDSFDALVVAVGRNDRQVRSIAEEIERLIEIELGMKPLREEGWTSGQWVALDYGDVIVHVFDEESRDYYDLEHLWNAAPSLHTEHTR